MRNVFVALGLSLTLTSPGSAQRWLAEIGIQAGGARLEPTVTGAGDRTDFFDFPGASLAGSGPTYPALYAIIPISGRLALEPAFGGSDLSALIGTSAFTLGLRADVALARGLYIAAGGALAYAHTSRAGIAAIESESAAQLGLELALGLRQRISGPLAARLEARVTTFNGNEITPPVNLYAILLGVSAGTGSPRAPRPERTRPWEPAIGMSASYARTHLIGGPFGATDLTTLSLPGHGAARVGRGTELDIAIATPPTLFLVLPIAGRLAFEVGGDWHRIRSNDSTITSAQIGVRMDYALGLRWYAGAGGRLHLLDWSDAPLVGTAGATVAAGYRFVLPHGFGGRIESSFTTFKERRDRQVAVNTLALSLALTAPLSPGR